MRKFVPGMIAIAMALGFSAFSSKEKTKFDTFYFKNIGTRTSLVWKYIGTSAPSAGDCDMADNVCYGESTSGHDANGNPLGSVTADHDGLYNP